MIDLFGFDFLSLIIASVALILSALSFFKTNKYNSASFFMELIREFRSPEFVVHRIYVKNQLQNEDILQLSAEGRDHILQLCHYFDTLGFLVKNDLIEMKMVKDFLGVSIIEYWEIVGPFIKVQRQERNFPEYQNEFENLALSCGFKR